MTHTNSTTTRSTLLLIAILSIVAIGGFIAGCRSDETTSLSGPALSVDEASAKRTEFNKRNPAGYTAGTTPGIAVTIDFSEYHREGQPYGEWTLHASWRACRKGCPELVSADVTVAIDADGRGAAFIPASFLNEVFQLAQQKYEEGKGDLGIWWNAQALVLDLFGAAAEGETLDDYYDVALGEEGYSYELSAGAVAGGLQQILKALGISWWPGKEDDLPQNLTLALNIGKCIGVTETPPAAPISTSSSAAGATWVLSDLNESCTDACTRLGKGACDAARFPEVYPKTACYDRLVQLGMPAAAIQGADTNYADGCRWKTPPDKYIHNDNGLPSSTCGANGNHRRACPCK